MTVDCWIPIFGFFFMRLSSLMFSPLLHNKSHSHVLLTVSLVWFLMYMQKHRLLEKDSCGLTLPRFEINLFKVHGLYWVTLTMFWGLLRNGAVALWMLILALKSVKCVTFVSFLTSPHRAILSPGVAEEQKSDWIVLLETWLSWSPGPPWIVAP